MLTFESVVIKLFHVTIFLTIARNKILTLNMCALRKDENNGSCVKLRLASDLLTIFWEKKSSVSDPDPDSGGLLDPDSGGLLDPESGSRGLKKGQKC